MPLFHEIPPTAGFPLQLKELLPWGKKRNNQRTFEENLSDFLGVAYLRVVSSGTAALYFILESLKELSYKKSVILPSYICPSVALAVARAGLKIKVCDINAYDFNFDEKKLEAICQKNNDILAVVVGHIGGIPADFEAVVGIAQKRSIFIIEDCAQSLGAEYRGKKVGTLGDFSFFSLARGKGMTIYEGGLLSTRKEENAGMLDLNLSRLSKKNLFMETFRFLELLGYAIFYRPGLFWFVYRFPEEFWNFMGNSLRAETEYFSINFPLNRVSRIRKGIGNVLFTKLEAQVEAQRQKAKIYIQRFEKIKGIKVVKEQKNDKATYPFVTLLIEDETKRIEALRFLTKCGLGVSALYGKPLNEYEYLKPFLFPREDFPGGHFFSRHQITLSTSAFLTEKEMETIISFFERIGHD